MGRRPFRINFENIYEMTAEDLVESEALITILKKEVPKAIDTAIKHKKAYASVFEINTFGVYVEIHKKDWVNALNTCLDLHTKEEDYESCVPISKTIELLKEKKQKNGQS
jgi:hypothetical protein